MSYRNDHHRSRPYARGAARQCETGFTLVEVMVALALLSLLALTISGAQSLGWRQYDVGVARAGQLDATLRASAVVRSMLESAVRIDATDSDASEPTLRFVGVLPAQSGQGGLHQIELRTVGAPGQQRLRLRAWRQHPDASSAASHDVELTLLEALARVRFAFAEDSGSEPRWNSNWAGRRPLPALVRVELQPAGMTSWPALVVAPRVELQGASR